MKDVISMLILVTVVWGCGGSGDDGEPGPEGFNALNAITTLESGNSNCSNGGTQIDAGVDNGDGDGIAGNGILESGEVDNTSFICTGSTGPAGSDDPVNSFYFERKFDVQGAIEGYKDLTFLNIGNQMSNSQIEVSSIKLIVDNTGTFTVQRALIKFDSLSEIITSEVTTNFTLNMAVLYINSTGTSFNEITGVDFTYVGARAIDETFGGNETPVYDPATVTWNNASASQLWLTPGIFNTDIHPSDDLVRIDLPSRGNFPRQWHALLLNRDEVAKWIESDSMNRGISLAILETDGDNGFTNARAALHFSNPILFIDVQEDLTGGRVKQKTEEEYRSYWESLTSAERLTPLFKYLESN